MYLHNVVPGLKRHTNVVVGHEYTKKVVGEGWCQGNSIYGNAYQFPKLKDCRDAFAQRIQQPIDWDDKEDWHYVSPYHGKEEEEGSE